MKNDQIYPNGHYDYHKDLTRKDINELIEKIEQIPVLLKNSVNGLNEDQLDTPYREGGWTIRQVVHHIADTQFKNFMRIRIALTSTNPLIKYYEVEKWAYLSDALNSPVEHSLSIVDGVHKRWADLLKTLTKDQLKRTFQHSDKGEISVDKAIGVYAWHGLHHIAQITALRERMGW